MPKRIMFQYWGRRGALQQFTLEVARAALAEPDIAPVITVSRQSELFEAFAELGPSVIAFDTFSGALGALGSSWRIPVVRRRLHKTLAECGIEAVIDLMPHVWSPFMVSAIHRAGALYIPIVHDAAAHPGDLTAWANRLISRSVAEADLVITLSEAVARQLLAAHRVAEAKLRTLFLPDLSYVQAVTKRQPQGGEAKRLLFLGRLMKYKGLSMFLDAVELLLKENIAVSVGVFGEGNIDDSLPRLRKLGAEVVNRWLSSDEIADTLNRFDVMVLPYLEASQSGVAATAFGAGLPVVATPVGGLVEQVIDGHTGVLAKSCSAMDFALAVRRVVLDATFYEKLCCNIAMDRESRSMRRFVKCCVRVISEAQQVSCDATSNF
jgi:glycosyltransferase involved in cell wall biosynthesis